MTEPWKVTLPFVGHVDLEEQLTFGDITFERTMGKQGKMIEAATTIVRVEKPEDAVNDGKEKVDRLLDQISLLEKVPLKVTIDGAFAERIRSGKLEIPRRRATKEGQWVANSTAVAIVRVKHPITKDSACLNSKLRTLEPMAKKPELRTALQRYRKGVNELLMDDNPFAAVNSFYGACEATYRHKHGRLEPGQHKKKMVPFLTSYCRDETESRELYEDYRCTEDHADSSVDLSDPSTKQDWLAKAQRMKEVSEAAINDLP